LIDVLLEGPALHLASLHRGDTWCLSFHQAGDRPPHVPVLLPCCCCCCVAVRPYFLPCAISALVNAVALALNLFVLRETLPHLVAARQAQQADSACDTGGTHTTDTSSSSSSSRSADGADQQPGLRRMLGSSAVRVKAALHSAAQRL